jgi:predicted O-linked N-acetylglucosamine transferase (SPINDLY family)
MQASALMDEAGFARRVEAAYAGMFTLWAEGKN